MTTTTPDHIATGVADGSATNETATAALVLGIVAIVLFSLAGFVGIFLARKARDEGKAHAQTAVVLNAIGIIAGGLVWWPMILSGG